MAGLTGERLASWKEGTEGGRTSPNHYVILCDAHYVAIFLHTTYITSDVLTVHRTLGHFGMLHRRFPNKTPPKELGDLQMCLGTDQRLTLNPESMSISISILVSIPISIGSVFDFV